MRILLLCGDNPNQIALANKIHEKYNLDCIISEYKKSKLTLKKIIERIIDKVLFSKIDKAWIQLMNYYKNKYPDYPINNILNVENVNSKTTVNKIKEANPDLIIVSGTQIIKKPILELPIKYGIMNLHTGLSPYVKGGPNCTNWCIAENKLHLIGNTIMWIDSGIDSGNIITTEQIKFTGNESFFEIHLKVMEYAHRLYLKSIMMLLKSPDLVPSVPQTEIDKGKLYLSKKFNFKVKKRLLENLKKFKYTINSKNYIHKFKQVKTIKFNSE